MAPRLDLVYRATSRDALVSRSLVVRVFRAAAPWLGIPAGHTAELGVQVVGPARMRSVNRQWRRVPQPTDVLAFPLSGPRIKGYTAVSLGDLFICPAKVREKAAAWGSPVRTQMAWTLVHGLLHLAGYDHEAGPAAARRMASLERTILKRLH